MRRLLSTLQEPSIQILLKLVLAGTITLLYAGHMFARVTTTLPEIARINTETLPDSPGAEAAFSALLGASLLLNTLFPKPLNQEKSDSINQINWLIGVLTLFLAISVGWNWLQSATDTEAPRYITPVLINTGLVLLAVGAWGGLTATLIYLRNRFKR